MSLIRWSKKRAVQLMSTQAVLLRPVIWVTIALGLLVTGELVIVGYLTWQNHQRINTIETDVRKGHQLEDSLFELLQLQATLTQTQLPHASDDQHIQDLEQQIIDLLQTQEHKQLADQIDLEILQERFATAVNGNRQSMMDSLRLVREVLNKQTMEEERLLIKIERNSQLELEIAMILPVLLISLGYFFFRSRVLEPLDSLKELLSGLANGVRQPITRRTQDPTINDLFNRYNRLVEHLLQLEQEHQNYTNLLESQVRETSHQLLEQSQRLAKAERLAALTEIAASTAHELRNPLAIIQISLENLLGEVIDPVLKERIHLLHQEAQRLTNHLNDLLHTAKDSNEAAITINVGQAVNDLISLLKFQIHAGIRLDYQGPTQLFARLPETEFRQMLLNLMQNAIQAIGANPGRVVINVAEHNQQITITVNDNGGGFSQGFLHQGVRPFVSLKEKGTGLGLVMVQRFVRSRQGHLKLDNPQPGHAQVTVSLPKHSLLN
jgi:two-component system, NtrC family, sensor kinase